MKFNKYFSAALFSFIIWGFFYFGFETFKNYPSLDILFYRVFLATLFLVLINLIFRKKAVQNDLVSFVNLEKIKNIKPSF